MKAVLTAPPGGKPKTALRHRVLQECAFAQIHAVLKPDSLCVSFYGWDKVDIFMAAAAGFRPVGNITFRKRYASSTRYLARHHEAAYLLAKSTPATGSRLGVWAPGGYFSRLWSDTGVDV